MFGVLFDDGEDGGGDDAVGAGEVVINFWREDVSITLPEKRAHYLSFNARGAGELTLECQGYGLLQFLQLFRERQVTLGRSTRSRHLEEKDTSA